MRTTRVNRPPLNASPCRNCTVRNERPTRAIFNTVRYPYAASSRLCIYKCMMEIVEMWYNPAICCVCAYSIRISSTNCEQNNTFAETIAWFYTQTTAVRMMIDVSRLFSFRRTLWAHVSCLWGTPTIRYIPYSILPYIQNTTHVLTWCQRHVACAREWQEWIRDGEFDLCARLFPFIWGVCVCVCGGFDGWCTCQRNIVLSFYHFIDMRNRCNHLCLEFDWVRVPFSRKYVYGLDITSVKW